MLHAQSSEHALALGRAQEVALGLGPRKVAEARVLRLGGLARLSRAGRAVVEELDARLDDALRVAVEVAAHSLAGERPGVLQSLPGGTRWSQQGCVWGKGVRLARCRKCSGRREKGACGMVLVCW